MCNYVKEVTATAALGKQAYCGNSNLTVLKFYIFDCFIQVLTAQTPRYLLILLKGKGKAASVLKTSFSLAKHRRHKQTRWISVYSYDKGIKTTSPCLC